MALWAGQAKAVPAGPGRDGWGRERRKNQGYGRQGGDGWGRKAAWAARLAIKGRFWAREGRVGGADGAWLFWLAKAGLGEGELHGQSAKARLVQMTFD
ncbi:hypothetical protein BY996DRAFT_6590892 [Phakopsora pachyrhizi]|nr:hypothetical protein BY996DRAFT_6590892 [Phakopsora pachyrhizi]